MPNNTLSMTMIEQIFRMKNDGISKSEISSRLGISRTTVKKYFHIIQQKNISGIWAKNTDQNTAPVLVSQPPSAALPKGLDDVFEYMDRNLKKTGFTRINIWRDYIKTNSLTYSYSQFCFLYQQHCKKTGASMHLMHKQGDKLFVDYAGKKLSVIDKETGEIVEVETFVAILGSSGYTYAEASASQKKGDFLTSLENTFHYIGGVPNAVVPDNLKSAVDKACKYEPKINETLEDFALHYGTVIIPARSRKPQDKALVENAVSNIYRSVYYALKDKQFFCIKELNEAIVEQLKEYNSKLYQGRNYSRKDMFAQEQLSLRPLADYRYELKQFCNLKVHKSSYILLSCDRHYYSVPYKYIGEKVKVVYNNRHVEIYKNEQRIAFHLRNRKPYDYTTEPEHLPSTHRFMAEMNPRKFIDWGKFIGKSTSCLIEKILQSKQHPEQAYKSCMGVQSLDRKFGHERLEKASSLALEHGTYSYVKLKNILYKNLDQYNLFENQLQFSIPLHENIRGSEYYH